MEYLDALELQRSLHQEIRDGLRENTLVIVEHPSVYTAGKRTEDHERPHDGTLVIDVDRGGKITWHGLGQLVGYPIIRLAEPTELVGYVREIESALIATCKELGLTTTRVDGRSGVWVVDDQGGRKIAAIGIRVAGGVTMHGFALNVEPDLSAFRAIIPCGIEDATVTSLAIELGRSISVEEVLPIVEKYMYESLAKVSR
jgi:lipoyl(octanoyl) transferase